MLNESYMMTKSKTNFKKKKNADLHLKTAIFHLNPFLWGLETETEMAIAEH